MTLRRLPVLLTGVLIAAASVLAACSSPPAADIPRIEETTFAVTPARLPVRIGILSGALTNLTVLQRVNAETGEIVYAPQLRGTLTLKNTSSDQAVRLVNGEVQYLDAGGAPIVLGQDRGDSRFSLDSYSSQRLDPGMEVTHNVDVPFPTAALDGTPLAEMRFNVTYIPAPYREASVELPVALADRR